jgi:GntR family transcriptional repressor for pyruvate dehydrogenase complex
MDAENIAEKKNPYTTIIERIRTMVIEGELVPGDRLPPERKLAERLGVSRGQLRRAFQALAERKMIESRQGDGTYLLSDLDSAPTVDAILEAIHSQHDVLHEIIEFRRMIEPQIAALAAQRIHRATLDRLKIVICDQQRALMAGQEADGLDAEFHQVLAESTSNRVISQVMTTIQTILNQSRSGWLQSGERRLASVEGHLRIIDALEAGDPQAASRAMQEHIVTVERHIFDRLDK